MSQASPLTTEIGRVKTQHTRPGESGPADFVIIPPSSPPPSLAMITERYRKEDHVTSQHRENPSGKYRSSTTAHYRSDRHRVDSSKSHRHAQASTSCAKARTTSDGLQATYTALKVAISDQSGKIDLLHDALEQMGARVTREILAMQVANDEKIKQLTSSVRAVLYEILGTAHDIKTNKALRAGADGGQCLWNTEWSNVQGGGVGAVGYLDARVQGVQLAAPRLPSQSAISDGSETFWTANGTLGGLEASDYLGANGADLPDPWQPAQAPTQPSETLDALTLAQLLDYSNNFDKIFGDNMSLNSGVETLPSECTRNNSVQPSGVGHDYASVPPNGRDKKSSPGGPDRTLRDRGKHPRQFTGHPTDRFFRKARREDRAALAARSSSRHRGRSDSAVSTESRRDIRGRSALPPIKLDLPASSGPKYATGVKWPPHGPNTMNGRLEEIACDECHGRSHWACAGLSSADKMLNEPWACPDCIYIRRREEGLSPVQIKQAQQERCIRPDCIVRSYKSMISSWDDGDRFQIERVVGRRRLSRSGSSKRVYEYLVKWRGGDWNMYDCTWEPARHIPDLEYYEDKFKADARKAGVDLIWKVAMLPITEQYWDSKGHLKLDRLEEEGIELKEWMIDHRYEA